MADGFSADIKGLKEVDEKLAQLGAVAGERVMRSSIFIAMEPIERRAKQGLSAIPTGSGALAKATRRVYIRPSGGPGSIFGVAQSGSRFVVSVAPKARDQVAVALANLQYRRNKKIRGVFWGHLMEWGHRIANRATGRISRAKGSIHVGGRVRGLRIFTKAYESGSLESMAIFRREIGRRVQSALRRQTRQFGS